MVRKLYILICVIFSIQLCRCIKIMSMSTRTVETLYDAPISNHGARVRMIIKGKKIDNRFQILSPMSVGGVKSSEYLRMNPLGKSPLLITEEGDNIPESDTISRYIIEKFQEYPPSFVPKTFQQKYLSEKICRIHDVYITCIQGAMYKAPGTLYSTFGTDRKGALKEMKNQLRIIEGEIASFEKRHPKLQHGPFLCGPEISLADVTLYPTMVMCTFILPQFYGWQESDFLGPKLLNWFNYMSTNIDSAKAIKEEMMSPLKSWKDGGRFTPIMNEMKGATV